MKYSNCYTPIKIDRNPLVDPKFFETIGDSEFSIFSKEILKPSVIELLETAGLKIENVVIWQWDLITAQENPPHTDGNFFFPPSARTHGINWLIEGDSVLDFWDKDGLNPVHSNRSIINYTIWYNPDNILPKFTCNTFPAIVNPQVPHRVRSVNGSTVRKSVIVYFKNVSYKDLQQILSAHLISRLSEYLTSIGQAANIYKTL